MTEAGTPRATVRLDRPHRPSTTVSHACRTLGEILLERAERTPDAPAAFQKVDGGWQSWSWRAFRDLSLTQARGLADLDCGIGDAVAVLGPTRLEWGVCDFAGQLIGATTFGVYPKQTPEQVGYLLEHSDCKVIYVADDDEMRTVIEAARELPNLKRIVAWTHETAERWRSEDERVTSMDALASAPMDEKESRERMDKVDPDAPAVLVYTSGTTGPPKGAMITHRNILTLLREHKEIIDFFEDDLLVSFLPMAHVSERILSFFVRIDSGVAAGYASSIGAVLQELPEIRPTLFGSVPRLFEKLYDRVHGEVGGGPAIRRKIFEACSEAARERVRCHIDGRPVPLSVRLLHGVGDRLVFSKIRAALGGNIRYCIAGAAPISYDILEFMWAVGLPIYEAYGMTEATVVTHMNRPGKFKLGSVGRPVPGVECRIADDGEILIRGETVFKGYYKDPEATAATVIDGWLHTGDIGEMDDEGYVRITDRKKHLIVTAGGKNVAPANIERAIKNQHPLISQVHAHGDRRAYVTALVAPSPLETLDWGLQKGILDRETVETRKAELLADPSARGEALALAMGKVAAETDFQKLFQEPIRQGNRDLAQVEKVRRYFVLGRDLSQEAGEMTPTMKMKRKVIEEKYRADFDRLYADPSFGFEVEAKKQTREP